MALRTAISVLLICLISIGALNGCALFELKDELKEYETTFRLTGKMKGAWDKDTPLLALLYRQEPQGFMVKGYTILDPEGHYNFLAPEGVYLLAVFEDINQNFRYDSGEHFGFANHGDPLHLDASQAAADGTISVTKLDIESTRVSGFPPDLPVAVDTRTLPSGAFIKVGVVTTLEDPRFSQENGSLGYWKPLTFLRDVGAGLFFLEKYDPQKIPVLFVHGVNGTPDGWQPLVAQLDRSKYQPWFFYYPSGLRINSIANALNAIIHSLNENRQLNKMVVVAHSMGGLVSRAFILKNTVEDRQTYIYKFISLSTPWGGVKMAAMGVKNSPVLMPNWIDVEPESQFIESLYAQELPERIKFYLIFGYRGKCSRMMDNNDGTIEIASELDDRAQREAERIFGYNEDHMSVMTSPEVLAQFKALMQ